MNLLSKFLVSSWLEYVLRFLDASPSFLDSFIDSFRLLAAFAARIESWKLVKRTPFKFRCFTYSEYNLLWLRPSAC